MISRCRSRFCKRFAQWVALTGLLLVVSFGCRSVGRRTMLPTKKEVTRDQLVIHTDFYLPEDHPLLDDLMARRDDMARELGIAISDAPIHVYLFSDREAFREFMVVQHPHFPDRRAFYVKNESGSMVYSFWGKRVGEDLRHEVTHGYLHAAVGELPLWMDEGLAEYFETPRDAGGVQGGHIRILADALRHADWKPNLARLETITSPHGLSQLDYAESWLWIHYLLHEDAYTHAMLGEALAAYASQTPSSPLSEQVAAYQPDVEARLLAHLKSLADSQ